MPRRGQNLDEYPTCTCLSMCKAFGNKLAFRETSQTRCSKNMFYWINITILSHLCLKGTGNPSILLGDTFLVKTTCGMPPSSPRLAPTDRAPNSPRWKRIYRRSTRAVPPVDSVLAPLLQEPERSTLKLISTIRFFGIFFVFPYTRHVCVRWTNDPRPSGRVFIQTRGIPNMDSSL